MSGAGGFFIGTKSKTSGKGETNSRKRSIARLSSAKKEENVTISSDPCVSIIPTPQQTSHKRRRPTINETVQPELFECQCGKKLKTKSGYRGHIQRCQSALKDSVVPKDSSWETCSTEIAIPETDAVDSTSSETAPKKPKGRKTKVKTPPLELPEGLPPQLVELELQFRSLNTIHTFCQVQRQMVCTFEGLRRSVKESTGRWGFETNAIKNVSVFVAFD